jgi:O-antigen ligase
VGLLGFSLGSLFAALRGLSEPVWAAMAACFVYFAVPAREFGVPELPYQAAFWGLALVASARYGSARLSWARTQLERRSREILLGAVQAVRAPLRQALEQEALLGRTRAPDRRLSLPPILERGLSAIDRRAPAPLASMLRDVFRQRLQAAIEDYDQAVSEAAPPAGLEPKGNLRVAFALRSAPVLDRSLSPASLQPHLERALEEAVYEEERTRRKRRRNTSEDGPLGYPLHQGGIGAALQNVGLWAQLLFVVLNWVGAQHAKYDYWEAMGRFENAYLLLLPMLAIARAIRTERHLFLFTLAWMAGVAFLAFRAATLWLHRGGRVDEVGGQGGEANFLGCITVFVLPVAFSLILQQRPRWGRVFGAGASGLYLLALLASGSRGAWTGALAASGYWLLHTRRRMIAAGMVGLAAAAMVAVAPESFWDRMRTIAAPDDPNPWVTAIPEASKEERLILWSLALEVWADHPWLGIGPQQFKDESAERTTLRDAYEAKRGMMAHNAYLQVAAEFGTIGLLVWGGAFVLSILGYRRARARVQREPEAARFAALCLGLEAGAVGGAVTIVFASFQWHDYLYWNFVLGPLALQIARQIQQASAWRSPAPPPPERPRPRYGPPRVESGFDLVSIDRALSFLSEA